MRVTTETVRSYGVLALCDRWEGWKSDAHEKECPGDVVAFFFEVVDKERKNTRCDERR